MMLSEGRWTVLYSVYAIRLNVGGAFSIRCGTVVDQYFPHNASPSLYVVTVYVSANTLGPIISEPKVISPPVSQEIDQKRIVGKHRG